MSLWKIAWRSIEQRSLASSLTALSMALGVALVVAVLVIHGMISNSFMTGSGLGYNLIVGADKGGKLQLVLNTVYYLSSPVENVPYTFYKEFTEGKYKPYVDKAIPVCLGDYYDQYRVVGTTPDFFNELTYNNGEKFAFAEGRNFKQEEFFNGVIGATVARDLRMKVGSEFRPTHGVEADHLHDPFRVVGVLAPTGTPNDRALFINMEGFYLTGDHAKPESKEEHTEAVHDADHPVERETKDAEQAHEHDDAHHDHANPEAQKKSDAHEHDHDHKHEAAKADDHNHEHDHDHAHDEPKKMSDRQPEAAHDHDHDHKHDSKSAEPTHNHAKQEKHDHGDHDHAHEKETDHDHDHEHGHDHAHHHDPLPESQREVTAVLLLTSSPPGAPPELIAQELMTKINEGVEGQAVQPIREISVMFKLFVEPVKWLLLGLTVLIVVVAGIGILVSIYNSMSERKHEIAVMRALGAGRETVMVIVLLESILLALGGGLFGWLLGHVLIWSLNPWLLAYTGVGIGLFQFVPLELVIIPGLIVLAAIVGYLPALVAYRTDVSKALSASP